MARWAQTALAKPWFDAPEVEGVATAAGQTDDARLPRQLVDDGQLKVLEADGTLVGRQRVGTRDGVLASELP